MGNQAVALNYFAYNIIKIHRTLRMSPAMAAGVTDRLWDVADLVTLWEPYEQRRVERAAQLTCCLSTRQSNETSENAQQARRISKWLDKRSPLLQCS
jgi:hypothetical protein